MDMKTLHQHLLTVLRPDQVTANHTIREHHSHDESYHTPVLPDLVVFVESTQDIVHTVRAANTYGVPLVPFGAGSSLEGHVVPVHGGISLDVTRMNRILSIRPDDFLVCVQPGVTRMQLNEALKPYGVFFPVDPGANATIGGMTATNASGTTTVRYGAMRDNVRSLEVVLPDGEIIRTGPLTSKSSSGYNLTSLFVGSEGTLGVFTEIWLKVYGVPEKFVAARATFPDVASCVRASTAMVGAGVAVARVELVDEEYIRGFNSFKQSDFPVTPTLFLEFHGRPKSIDMDVQMAREICEDEGCTGFDCVEDEKSRNRLWEIRHAALHAFMSQYPGMRHMATDVCVPISQLANAIGHAQRVMREMGVRGGIVGHVGDGNFHAGLAVNPEDADDMHKAYQLNEAIVSHALELGGTCTGEHGVGLGKMKYQNKEHGAALTLMRVLKQAIDPNGIMNPGKLVDSGDTLGRTAPLPPNTNEAECVTSASAEIATSSQEPGDAEEAPRIG